MTRQFIEQGIYHISHSECAEETYGNDGRFLTMEKMGRSHKIEGVAKLIHPLNQI
jgi:hypothetical protein